MVPDDETNSDLKVEALRLYEDCTYNSRGHFILSQFWSALNLWLNLPAILLSALTATLAFVDVGVAAAITAVAVLLITTSHLFLNPAEKSERHKTAAERYLALKGDLRIFYSVRIKHGNEAKKSLLASLGEFSQRKNQLNSDSPSIPDWAYARAKSQIEEGRSDYAVDVSKEYLDK